MHMIFSPKIFLELTKLSNLFYIINIFNGVDTGRLLINQCNVLSGANMPKGVGNKGKAIKKKSNTSGMSKTLPKPKKLIMVAVPQRSQRHVKKTRFETEDQKLSQHRLEKAGLIPKDPVKTCNWNFV